MADNASDMYSHFFRAYEVVLSKIVCFRYNVRLVYTDCDLYMKNFYRAFGSKTKNKNRM